MTISDKFLERRNSKRKVIKWIACTLSSLFTFFWAWDFFGHDTWWKIIVVNPGITILVMLILSYSIGQLMITNNYVYLVPIFFAVTTSLLGTTGTLMQGIVKQIMGTAYWSQLDEASRYVTSDLKALDGQSQQYDSRGWPRNQERVIDKKQKSVDQLIALNDRKNDLVAGSSYTGAGALAYIAKRTGISGEDIFWIALVIISLFIDCMFIETTVQENLEELGIKAGLSGHGGGFLFWKRNKKEEPRPEPRRIPPRPPIESPIPNIARGGNGVEHRPTPPLSPKINPQNTDNFEIKLRDDKKKIDKLNEANKRAEKERMQLLKDYISKYPDATNDDKKKACGVKSINTVKTYEKKLGIRS